MIIYYAWGILFGIGVIMIRNKYGFFFYGIYSLVGKRNIKEMFLYIFGDIYVNFVGKVGEEYV